jgi:hypothetical protein
MKIETQVATPCCGDARDRSRPQQPQSHPEEACGHNLCTIDGTMQTWEVRKHKTTNDSPTCADLQKHPARRKNPQPVPASLRVLRPVCPALHLTVHAARHNLWYALETRKSFPVYLPISN